MRDPYVKALAKRVLDLEDKLERAVLTLELIKEWSMSDVKPSSFIYIQHEVIQTLNRLRSGFPPPDETVMPCPGNE